MVTRLSKARPGGGRLQPRRRCGTRLHVQIRERLERWLAKLPPGAAIPSEYALAAEAGVNRRTVRRAVLDLIAAGRLVRVRRTTRVPAAATVPAALDAAGEVPHPLTQHSWHPLPVPRRVVIANYEYLPWQRQGWQAVSQACVAAHPGLTVEHLVVPPSVDGVAAYAAFLRAHPADIALCAVSMLRDLVAAGTLQELPAFLAEAAMAPDSLWPTLGAAVPEVLRHALPIHVGIAPLLLNQEILDGLGAPALASQALPDVLDWLLTLTHSLPPGVLALHNPVFLLMAGGLPEEPMRAAALETLLEDLANWAARLKAQTRHLGWSSGREPATSDAFLTRQVLAHVGHSFYAPGRLAQAGCRYRSVFPTPVSGRIAPVGCTCAALTTRAAPAGAAADVLRFLIAREGQELLAQHRLNCPMHRAALSTYEQALSALLPGSLAALVPHLRQQAAGRAAAVGLFEHAWTPLLAAWIQGARGTGESAALRRELQQVARRLAPGMVNP